MKNWIKTILGLLVLGSTVVEAAPVITQQVTPGTISYQGRLQTSDGADYVNGIYTVDFKLYDSGDSKTLLWGATYKPYVNNGFFSVILGQTQVGEVKTDDSPLEVDEFWKGVWIDPNTDSRDRFLGITVHENENNAKQSPVSESFPRQQLLASPFAIQAQFAQQAEVAQQATDTFEVPGVISSIDKTYITVDDDIILNQVLDFSGTTAEIRPGSNGEVIVSGDLDVRGGDITCSSSSKSLTLTSGSDYIDMMDRVVFKNGLHINGHVIDNVVEAPKSGIRVICDNVTVPAYNTWKQYEGFKTKLYYERVGQYQISWTPAFSEQPTVVVTPHASGRVCYFSSLTSGSAILHMENSSGTHVSDNFSIIAIGK